MLSSAVIAKFRMFARPQAGLVQFALCGSHGARVALLGTVLSLASFESAAVEAPASAEEALDAYNQWTVGNIEALAEDMPSITAAAEAAAEKYVTGDWGIAAAGDYGVLAEACGRSGGIMALKWGYPPNYLKLSKDNPQIVLFALREDRYDKHLRDARKVLDVEHAFVVVMGPQHLLDRAREDGMPMQASFAVHSAEGEGLFEMAEGERLAPTTPVASMAALWAWTAEFVAACTRHGKMPVMHESYAIPGAKERAEKLKGQKFYDEPVKPVAAGELGRLFLKRLRENVEAFYTNERGKMLEAVKLAWQAREAGKELYTFVHGHSVVQDQVKYAKSPQYLTKLNKNWHKQDDRYTLEEGDFVFCLGYDHRYQGNNYGTWHDDAREAGATLVWSLATYRDEHTKPIREADELLIDQHWEYGDAVVPVPGTDVTIAPTSGHIAQMILRMFNAGLIGCEQQDKQQER
ncbi:MAG: hypothetical protein ACOCWJ_05780 [Verrucomicrobiota bacterium]